MLTIEMIRDKGWLIFEAITGSRAYGLDTPASDTDIRGVFVLPKEEFYSLDRVSQVSNATNDIVYYELGRFVELLSKNNPNILEMLNIPDEFVLYSHRLMDYLQPDIFLSRLCEKTYANYAYTQIKKAYGLEKKILNPVDAKRKTVLDFCFIYNGKEAIPASVFLEKEGMDAGNAGLAAIPHLKDCYNLYCSAELLYAGIVRKEESNDVALSSVPKSQVPVALLYFNRDGYSVYCKKYSEYWNWVAKRNEDRYQMTLGHGKNYDSKNMMHVFRLLLMAKEIAVEQRINVKRNDRDFLLNIKAGKFEYDELLQQADELKNELPALYSRSGLQEEPDLVLVNKLLVKMRDEYYKTN